MTSNAVSPTEVVDGLGPSPPVAQLIPARQDGRGDELSRNGDGETPHELIVTDPSLANVSQSEDQLLADEIHDNILRSLRFQAAGCLYGVMVGFRLQELKLKKRRGFWPWCEKFLPDHKRRTLQWYLTVSTRLRAYATRVRNAQRAAQLSDDEILRLAEGMKLRELDRLLAPPKRKPRTVAIVTDYLIPLQIVERLNILFAEGADVGPCGESVESLSASAKSEYPSANGGLDPDSTWCGNVFVHPPNDESLPNWINRAVTEFEEGRLRSALLLLPAYTDADWMERVKQFPRLFVRGRLALHRASMPDGLPETAAFPSTLVLLANDDILHRFVAIFGDLGDVFVPYTTPQ